MLQLLKRACLAFAVLLSLSVGVASPAAAGTCSGPYTGNTSGVDSSAMVSALNDLCGAAAPLTPYSVIWPNNTTGVLVGTAGARQIGSIEAFNNSSTIAYVKLYDTATAPTCGSGTPVWRGMVPGLSGGAGFTLGSDFSGKKFVNGIGLCVTTGVADNDTTAPAANAYLINIGYK